MIEKKRITIKQTKTVQTTQNKAFVFIYFCVVFYIVSIYGVQVKYLAQEYDEVFNLGHKHATFRIMRQVLQPLHYTAVCNFFFLNKQFTMWMMVRSPDRLFTGDFDWLSFDWLSAAICFWSVCRAKQIRNILLIDQFVLFIWFIAEKIIFLLNLHSHYHILHLWWLKGAIKAKTQYDLHFSLQVTVKVKLHSSNHMTINQSIKCTWCGFRCESIGSR